MLHIAERRSPLPGRARFLLRRLVRAAITFVVTIFCLSAVVNATMEATVRGQIAEAAQAAVLLRGDLKTKEDILAFRREIVEGMELSYGLGEPRWKRVAVLAWRIMSLDLGDSRYDRTEYPELSHTVRSIILERLPHTLILFTASTVLSAALGVALGAAMARRPGGPLDRGSSLAAMVLYGTPTWWVATFMILFFVYAVPVFRVGALRSPAAPDGIVAQALDYLSYLALPLCTLVLVKLWGFAYLARSMIMTPMQEDFVMAARARGLPERTVLARHGLRVAAPGIATMAAQALAQSIMGDMLVEKALSRPGLGQTLFMAIRSNDTALFTGVIAVVAAVYSLSFVALDAAYAWLDPRIAYGRS